jgi:radical SAM protein with 4Fe4S-binding SPASM domain
MHMLRRSSDAPRLRLLVHKPTFACTAKCAGCEQRRQLHRASRRHELLTFEQNLELYDQAAKLGVSELHLSGGEATLYPRLPELVEAGKRHGWFVMLNTNGSQFVREDLVERLFAAGLDGVMLSLYSHREEVHDSIRQQRGLWQRAVHGLGLLARYRRERHPGFFIVTQSILSRDNLFDAPELLRLVGERGSDVHLFSYMEGDFEARLVPTVDMIARFRAETVGRLRQAVRALPEASPLMKAIAWWRLGLLFSNARNSDANYARCIYNETDQDCRRCGIPNEFMLVLPDGNVHPCNVVEYTHEPVVGNFRETGDLQNIWLGEAWQRFRTERHDWCRRCPMTYHNWVPLNLTLGRAARLLKNRV